MAQSPAHRLGQIIGDQLELAVRQPLEEIAEEFDLYLDYKHPRRARNGRKKVSWKDSQGNTHDLDYVLEEGGSEKALGRPRAFIETAWRRYTKHSRNKAQEIQGAITPLAKTYQNSHPFLGAVLAGVFTEGSLAQFRSHDFSLAYCPYETIVRAFATEGVDVSSEENSPELELQDKVAAFEQLNEDSKRKIAGKIRQFHSEQFDRFFQDLRSCLNRRVECVFVLALSGKAYRFESIEEAVDYVSNFDQSEPTANFVRYELNIRYSNGDEIRGNFEERERAIKFLRSMEN